MGGFPEPRVGLVVSYSYLWSEEAEQGLVEGKKDRPCAIILAVDEPAPNTAQRKQVAVAPITHSPPRDMSAAVEIPPRVKEHLGLDSERSWVILNEVNVFTPELDAFAKPSGPGLFSRLGALDPATLRRRAD
jgi:hypothetical protein